MAQLSDAKSREWALIPSNASGTPFRSIEANLETQGTSGHVSHCHGRILLHKSGQQQTQPREVSSMSIVYRVLQVEDSVEDALFNLRQLQRQGLEVVSQ